MSSFTCHVCGKAYKTHYSLKYHIAHHSDERPFPCDFLECSNAFKTKADLKQHQKTHEKDLGVRFPCHRCDIKFKNSTQLNVHNRKQHQKRLNPSPKSLKGLCKICNRHFKQLGNHIQYVHTERALTCDLCGKKFSLMSGLRRHIHCVHLQLAPFECDFCSKKFRGKQDRDRHVNKFHLELKPYACQMCDKKFIDEKDLRRHVKGHMRRSTNMYNRNIPPKLPSHWSDDEEVTTEVLQIDCGSCTLKFTSRDRLQKHMDKCHPDCPFSCDLCDQRFISKKKIAEHIVDVHLLDLPQEKVAIKRLFRCGLCKKLLSQNIKLEQHKRAVHFNIFDFLCDLCPARFSVRQKLATHRVNVHKQPAVEKDEMKCQHCGKEFRILIYFEKHEAKCLTKKLNRNGTIEDIPEDVLPPSKREPSVDFEDSLPAAEFLDDASPVVEFLDDASPVTEVDLKHKTDEPSAVIFIQKEPAEGKLLKFNCELCAAKFKFKEDVTRHFQSVHVVKPPTEAFTVLSSVWMERFKCKTCQQMFNHVDDLKQHISMDHERNSEDDDGIFRCALCPRAFITVVGIKLHMKAHERERKRGIDVHPVIIEHAFHCPLCPRTFDTAVGLKHHSKLHEKEKSRGKRKPLSEDDGSDVVDALDSSDQEESDTDEIQRCAHCTRTFITRDALKVHSKIHEAWHGDADDVLRCTDCPRTFTSKMGLSVHKRSHEKDNKWPNEHLRCAHCPQTFRNKVGLGLHRRVHETIEESEMESEPEVFSCAYCPRTFKRSIGLKLHTKVHEAERDESAGEPEDIEEEIRQMFTGGTFNFTSFECKLCPEVFQSTQDLKFHCVMVHRIKKFKCRRCKHSFCRLGQFRAHWTKKHRSTESFYERKFSIPNEDIKCPLCPSIFTQTGCISDHMALVHDVGKFFVCDHCGRKCRSLHELRSHMVKVHLEATFKEPCKTCGKLIKARSRHRMTCEFKLKVLRNRQYLCVICQQIIKSRFSARRHFTQAHGGGTMMMRTCGACNMEFHLNDDFVQHVADVHDGMNICLVCGEFFRTTAEFVAHCQQHRRVMDSDKRFACDLCGYKAQQKVKLKDHMNQHHRADDEPEGSEVFTTCEICGVSFTAVSLFHQHMKAHETQAKVKIQCAYCEKCYANAQTLRDHEKSHVTDEIHRCNFPGCTNKYSNFASFRWHERYAHTKIPNQCRACNEVFSSHEKLLAHVEQAHPKMRKHRCECGKSYSAEVSLMKHKEICS